MGFFRSRVSADAVGVSEKTASPVPVAKEVTGVDAPRREWGLWVAAAEEVLVGVAKGRPAGSHNLLLQLLEEVFDEDEFGPRAKFHRPINSSLFGREVGTIMSPNRRNGDISP